jgi:hypothetical protein
VKCAFWRAHALHIECDPWEGMHDGFVNFTEVRDRLAHVIAATFPGSGLRVLDVCGADHFTRCGLENCWSDCALPGERGIYVHNRTNVLFI